MKKISFLLISFLIFTIVTRNTYTVYADAGQLVVGGGSIPTGGLSGLDQLAYTVPIFGALLSAFGIGVNISEQSQQAGMTKTEYIADQILRWKGNKTNALNNAITEFLGGAQIDINGMIYLTDYALDIFTQFGNWVVSNNGSNFVNTSLSSNDTYNTINGVDVSLNLSVGDRLVGIFPNQNTNRSLTMITITRPVSVAQYQMANGWYALIFLSLEQNAGITYQYNSGNDSNFNSYTLDYRYGNYYSTTGYAVNYQSSLIPWDGVPIVNHNDIPNWGIWENSGAVDVPYDDYFEGNPSEWIDNLPSLDIPQGYTGAIDPGILTGLENGIAENRDCIISIKDYIEALGEAVNEGVNDVSIPVTDTGTGTIVDVPAVDFPVDFPVYDPVADPDMPSEGELTPAVDPVSPATPEDIIPGATLDLTSIFPFCIPFDLYAIMQKFIAEPEAPNIDIELEIPGIYTIDETYSLEQFDTVALVLRNMEIVLFVIGLAVATRRIYLRG